MAFKTQLIELYCKEMAQTGRKAMQLCFKVFKVFKVLRDGNDRQKTRHALR